MHKVDTALAKDLNLGLNTYVTPLTTACTLGRSKASGLHGHQPSSAQTHTLTDTELIKKTIITAFK